jgi:DHA2 family multidrug resistance protein
MSTVEYGTRRTVIVIGVMLASFLGRIDGTIVNVALPTIQGNLGASFDEVTWVIIGYLMANVTVVPLTPWLALRFGRRDAFVAAIAGFTVMSLLCATSTSVQWLVFFRIAQGLFAGGIDSAANTVLTSTFPSDRIGIAQSVFSLSAAAAPPIGLLLGGILTDNLSWQWCFLINVPLGAAAAIALGLMLRNPDRITASKRVPFDAIGIALLAAGPSLLVYFLSEGDRYDWLSDSNLVLAAVLGTLATAGFILWELRGSRAPIVDLRILKYRRVAVGAVVFVAGAFVYLSSMVALPQYAQEVLGYTPTQAGLLILERAIPTAICVPIAGWLAARGYDLRVLIASGFAVMFVGTYWQSTVMTPNSDAAALLWPLTLAGVGNAFAFSPLFIAIIGGVPHHERAKAASITSVTIQFAGALATSVLISTLHIRAAIHQTVLAANTTLSRFAVVQFIHQFGPAQLNVLIEDQSKAYAYADVGYIVSLVALAGAAVTLMLGKENA